MEGIALELTEDAVQFIAEKALEYKLGARGLRSLCEAILTDAMFDPKMEGATERKLVIDRAYAEGKLSKSRISKLRA
jgi:ATP-dependent Clp protease ATP-binding subunit ClpX